MTKKDEMRQAGIAYERPYKQLMADSDSQYWQDVNTIIMVYPTLDNPKTARPFVVRISSEHWIPVNHLVFASDEQEARRRLLDAMEWCALHEYEGRLYGNPPADILKKYADGKMHLEVEELDIMGIYDVEWSSRGF